MGRNANLYQRLKAAAYHQGEALYIIHSEGMGSHQAAGEYTSSPDSGLLVMRYTLTRDDIRRTRAAMIYTLTRDDIPSLRLGLKKALQMQCFFHGDPYGNRTHVSTLRGWRLSRLTNGPFRKTVSYQIISFLSIDGRNFPCGTRKTTDQRKQSSDKTVNLSFFCGK